MANEKQNKCEHIPCRCDVAPGQKYCGAACKDAGKGDVEIACQCGHSHCPLVA